MRSSAYISPFALVVALALALVTGQPSASEFNAEELSVKEFLDSGGRLELEAMRRSGYEGPLDVSGFSTWIDSRTGEPRFSPAAEVDEAPGDDHWWAGFNLPGVSGRVHALAIYNSTLIVGGDFSLVDATEVRNIAAWDGNEWHNLGTGTDFGVRALMVYDGKLIAGGLFSEAGGNPASHIASWDGYAWSALGSGTNGTVLALAMYGGDLIVGGSFGVAGGVTASNIASWDGNAWSRLGSGTNEAVFTLASFAGDLVSGGIFTVAGGLPANRVASWNGAAWSALGSGTNGLVRALVEYQGDLIAGGDFLIAGGIPAMRVARWDGNSWNSLNAMIGQFGCGFETPSVEALLVHTGELIVGGRFADVDGRFMGAIARWDGSTWNTLGDGMSWGNAPHAECPEVSALAVFGDDLIAGGAFLMADYSSARSIARWDGNIWLAVGKRGRGMNNRVNTLAVYEGDLIVGGEFTQAGLTSAGHIVRWDGSSWEAMGSGSGWPLGINDRVFALTVHDGSLFAGGAGIPDDQVAVWNGGSWVLLGSGFDGTVLSLASYGGDLIAGGVFTEAGGAAANRIARWNGLSWAPLGLGADGAVNALATYGGELIAGGRFGTAGGTAASAIASWNGLAWNPLGTGMTGGAFLGVLSLTVHDGNLVAGGNFELAGGQPASNIASWNGNSWSALGTGVLGEVTALGAYNGDLISGGSFARAGGSPATNIARWNGLSWSPMGSGVGDFSVPVISNVAALTVFMGNLYVGGDFLHAGGKPSYFIARWDDVVTTVPSTPQVNGRLVLEPCMANPFRPPVVFHYTLSRAARTRVTLHDVQGRRLTTLVDGHQDAGQHGLVWDGRDHWGTRVASGVYFAQLRSGGEQLTAKVLIAR